MAMGIDGSVLVTGANRGIGLELIRQLAPTARRVIATCRDPAAARALTALAEAENAVEVRPLDVTDFAAVDALAQELSGQPLDLVINNAGVYGSRTSPPDPAAWLDVLAVNTVAPIYLSHAVLPSVLASETRKVVNISSKVGSMADNHSGGAPIYRSSKAALNSATRSLAIDHAGQGLIAFVLHPGWVQTDMGGPNALINSATSVRGMLKVIADADAASAGRFFNYDGAEIPW
ncbi:MAG: SDR family oxidoreductase [Pseudomonadota bacterium]